MSYHCNFIYNRADGKETEDSEIALNFVEFLDGKISGWGYSCYIPDRDCLAGKNVFDELFTIVRKTEKTLVVITPGFRSNCWAKYSKQAAFKYLLDCQHQHKLIPIALNIDNNESLRELNVNEPIHIKGLNEEEWENRNKRCFDKLRKTFDKSVPPRVVEEIGDNRLRTEGRQQLVTRPASDTSLSSALSPGQVPEERYSVASSNNNHNGMEDLSFLSVSGDSNTADSDVFHERSSTQPLGAHEETSTERILYQRSGLDQIDGGNGQILSNPVIDGGTSLRNVGASEISTHRNHNSISDDNDLSTDTLQPGPTLDTENNTVTLVSRPETLGAEGDVNGTEVPGLSLDSFEQDEKIAQLEGSSDQDQTIPKQAFSESGYTPLYKNSFSPERQCSLQNHTDDEKEILHDARPHSLCIDSKTSDRSSPGITEASGSTTIQKEGKGPSKGGSTDEMDGSSTEKEGKKPPEGGSTDEMNGSSTENKEKKTPEGDHTDEMDGSSTEKEFKKPPEGDNTDGMDGSSTEQGGKKPSVGETSPFGALLSICVDSLLHGDLAFK